MPNLVFLEKFFLHFSPENLWRILIDGNRQNQVGPLGFDEDRESEVGTIFGEPGYLKSMFNALNFILETIEEPISLSYILKLHAQSVSQTKCKVVGTTSFRQREELIVILNQFEEELRNSVVSLGLVIEEGDRSNVSENGFFELIHRIKKDDRFSLKLEEKAGVLDKSSDIHDLYKTVSENKTSLHIDAKKLEESIILGIGHYMNLIAKAENDDQKIQAIVYLVHELEIIHPFYDGNCRAFG